jgi:DNA replication protein DnaC
MLARAKRGESVQGTGTPAPAWEPPAGPFQTWDDMDVKAAVQNCEHCRGLGKVRHDLPIGHPDFGKLFPCPVCGHYTVELTRRRQTRKLKPLIDRFSILNQSDPRTFAEYKVTQHNRAAVEAVRRWVNGVLHREAGVQPWLYLHSDTNGNGKTHLGVAAALNLERAGLAVVLATMPGLKNMVTQKNFEHQDDVKELLFKAPALILDDLGAENNSSFTQGLAFDILDTRYIQGKPTMIISNHHPQRPGANYVSLKALDYYRLASRCTDIGKVNLVSFDAEDYRPYNR